MFKSIQNLFFPAFVLTFIILTIFRIYYATGNEPPSLLRIAPLISMAVMVVSLIIRIIFLEKNATKPVFIRSVSDEERNEINSKLQEISYAASHAKISIVVLVLAILFWKLDIAQLIWKNEIFQGVISWIYLASIVFSGIILVISLRNLDLKRRLENDLREGVFSISGLGRLGVSKGWKTGENIYAVRIGKLLLSLESVGEVPRMKDLMEKNVSTFYIEYFAGSKRIVRIDAAT